jgi:hypothetical protein
MAVSARGMNASLELANLEMEAKERAKKHVANLLRVSILNLIFAFIFSVLKNRGL